MAVNIFDYFDSPVAPATSGGGRKQTTTKLRPELQEAYTGLLGTAESARGKAGRSQVDVLSYVDKMVNVNQPLKKKPGLLQQIMGSKVSQAVLAPLTIIDVPRRAIISGLKEAYDAGYGGDSSFEDFVKQVKDPSFGVGKFVNTGNKWVDRGLGFLGDVALDPTTYLTLGAGKFAGTAGRLALAQRLSARGATEELVSRAGRVGLLGLKPAERAAFDLPKAGLRFGFGEGAAVIPGTERFATAAGRAMSGTRAAIGSTKAGGVLRRSRLDEAMLPFTERLLSGKGAVSARDAANTLSAKTYRDGTQGLVLSEIVQSFEPLRRAIAESPDPRALTAKLERGEIDDAVTQQAFNFFNDLWGRMDDAGVNVNFKEKYVPHVWTKEGRSLLSDDSKFAEDFRKVFGVPVNEVRAPTAVRTRVFIPKPDEVYEIAGKKLTFPGSTIDDINSVFQREFGFKVLEDDLGELIKGYSQQVSRAIGNRAFEDRLMALGTARLIDDVSVDVVDKKATKAQKQALEKNLKQYKKEMEPQVKAAQENRDAVRKEYEQSVKAVVKRVRENLKGRKVTLNADLKSMTDDLGVLLDKNGAEVIDLQTQARSLDEIIRRTQTFVDEANLREQRLLEDAAKRNLAVDQVENSAIYRDLINNRDYADNMLAEVKAIRAELDDTIRQIDESVIELPKVGELPSDIVQASTKSMAPVQPTEVQPYRNMSSAPAGAGYQAKNAFEEFSHSFHDARMLVKNTSERAFNLFNESARLIDEADNLAASRTARQGATTRIPLITSRYEQFKPAYDIVYDKAAKAFDGEILYGSVTSLSKADLAKLGINDNEYRVLQLFEQDVLPDYKTVANIQNAFNSAPQQQQIDQLRVAARRRAAEARQAALEDFERSLDSVITVQPEFVPGSTLPAVASEPVQYVSPRMKQKMLEEYGGLLDAYQRSAGIMDSVRSQTDNITSQYARALAKDSLAAKAALDDVALRVRMQFDFAARYTKTAELYNKAGIVFNPDAVGAMVAKNVVSSEIKRVQRNIDNLVAARTKSLLEATGILNAAKSGDARVAAQIGKIEGALLKDVENYTQFIRLYLDEYNDLRIARNRAYRGKVDEVTAQDLINAGIDPEDISAGGGLKAVNAERLDSDFSAMQDIQRTIELGIFGETAVRPKGYSFNKFFDAVTDPGVGNKPTTINPAKLSAWMRDNAKIGLTEQDINRIGKAGRLANQRTAAAPTVAGAIGEQIDELRGTVKRLQASAELLGRGKPRLGKGDRAALETYREIMGGLVDYDDPVAVANEIGALTRRISQLKSRTIPAAKGRPAQRVKGEIERIDDLITENIAKSKALGSEKEVVLNPQMTRRVAQLRRERVFLQQRLDGGLVDDIPKANFRLEKIDKIIAEIEKKATRFVKNDDPARALFDERMSLIARKQELVDDLARSEREVKFFKRIVEMPPRELEPKAGYATKNWQNIMFGGSLGKSRLTSRSQFVRERAELLGREIELRAKLQLPNQSILNGQVQEITDVISRLGDPAQLTKEINKLQAERKVLEAAAASDAAPNVILKGGFTKSGAATRLKTVNSQIKKLEKSMLQINDNIARRDEIASRIQGGIEPEIAQAAKVANEQAAPIVDAAQRERNFTERQVEAAQGSAGMARLAGAAQVDNTLVARNAVQQQIDNTQQIARDANAEFLRSKQNILGQIADAERQLAALRNRPSVGNLSDPRAVQKIEELSLWLDDAYALTDPVGYQQRAATLGVPVAGQINGNQAQQIAALQLLPDSQEKFVTLALIGKAKELELQLLSEVENVSRLNSMVDGAKDLKFGAVMKRQIMDGWDALPNSKAAVPREVQDGLERIMRLDKPADWASFQRMWDAYTDVFKAYATMRPGFHVRNALSATMMNYVDGVATKNGLDGARMWRMAKNDPQGWISKLPAEQQAEARDALLATYAAGLGQYADFEVGATRGARNRFVRASQNVGTTVEGSVRFGMALDTIRNGGTIEEAAARISRIHFNYSDVSKVDKYAKRVIPFWTFMSRNIPLQMQQIWLKPRVYQIYASAVRNVQGEPTGEPVPSWYSESDIFKSPIGGGYIRPDMAFSGLENQFRQATTARGLASQVTPIARVPLEILFGQKAFTGQEFKEGEAPMYAAEQIMPLLNTIRGLAGIKGGAQAGQSEGAAAAAEASQGDAQLNAIRAFLGIPYITPTVQQQRGELVRRNMLLQEYINKNLNK